jgi:uncharacterized protein YjiS (DUF1127 family)
MTMITNIPNSVTTVPIGRKFAAYLGDRINHWLAAWIARQEREVARKMLLSFSDRQLRDMGLCRSQIDYALNNPHQPD